jgi:hypothetical protein
LPALALAETDGDAGDTTTAAPRCPASELAIAPGVPDASARPDAKLSAGPSAKPNASTRERRAEPRVEVPVADEVSGRVLEQACMVNSNQSNGLLKWAGRVDLSNESVE